MLAILAENVLFILALVAVGAVAYYVLLAYTPLGLRLRQNENRRRIQREAEAVCPVHGPHAEQDLVRLASGERICPECFREAVRDVLN
ncbi:MAG TPA: hypothetical protein VMT93_08320 [Gemmatimonadaceae bacterium]|nr:hypothetical protein [Gemmatimonadaceae bacterium]